MFVCPADFMDSRVTRNGKKDKSCDQGRTYYFDTHHCHECPRQQGCYQPGAKTKTYSVTIKSRTHQDQRTFQATQAFQDIIKLRYRIDAKNAAVKTKHSHQ